MPGLGRDVGADVVALYRGIRNLFRQERTSPGNIGNDIPISGGHGPRSSAYGDPERMVHGVANGREFDPTQAGGPVRNLSTEGVRITNRGIDVVERHISRFQPDEANNFTSLPKNDLLLRQTLDSRTVRCENGMKECCGKPE